MRSVTTLAACTFALVVAMGCGNKKSEDKPAPGSATVEPGSGSAAMMVPDPGSAAGSGSAMADMGSGSAAGSADAGSGAADGATKIPPPVAASPDTTATESVPFEDVLDGWRKSFSASPEFVVDR